MSDYYTVTGSPANRSSLSSAVIRSEFASLAAGFAKVAPYTGHSGEIVRINAGGTGQESVSFASLLLTNIVIAGSLSGVTSLSMAGTITGTTDMTMSGTLNGVNIITTGNTTLGNAASDTLNASAGTIQLPGNSRVGINTVPGATFHVDSAVNDEVARLNATSNPFLSIYRGGVRYGYLQFTSSQAVFNVEQNIPLLFYTNSAERVRIDASGNVGVGGSPIQKFDVFNGHIKITDGFSFLWGDSSTKLEGNSTTDVFSVYTNTTERVRIDASGNVGIGSSSPDPCKFTVKNNVSTGIAGINVNNDASLNGYLFIGGSAHATTAWRNNLVLWSNAGQDVVIDTNGGTECARFNSSGNVGIGGAPTTKLHVFTGATARAVTLQGSSSTWSLGPSGANLAIRENSSGSDFFTMTSAGATTFSSSVTAGSFSGPLTGNVTGNAATATALQTARNINGVAFDGTANISVNLNNALTAGSGLTSAGTFDGSAARTFAVDSTSTNTASKIVARDASGNFSAGTITATLSGNASTATALNNALTAGSFLTSSGTFDGSTARTFAVDATSANTASKVVARDASGNFSAGTITAALSGNASTATALQTARNINGVAFDGTGNITVAAAAATLTGTTLPALDGGALTNLNASNLASGTVGTARLGSGTANSTKYLRGDSTWQDAPLSGTYTPTATAVSNCTSPSANKAQYLRVGNVVTVSGSVDINVTAGGATTTEVDISLPIASNLSALSDLCGSFTVNIAITSGISRCDANTTNDRARLIFSSSSTGGANLCYTFTYEVI